MPKAMCIIGIVIAVLLLLVFGLDMVVEFPFGKASPLMDIGMIVSAAILAYIGWTTWREQV